MPKYLFEATYVGQGIKEFMQEGGTARRDALTEALKSMGGTLESFYCAFGHHDVLGVSEVGGLPPWARTFRPQPGLDSNACQLMGESRRGAGVSSGPWRLWPCSLRRASTAARRSSNGHRRRPRQPPSRAC
ncbi:GYD domain-containing protein [Pseudarthrobacter chlorophenolicus]|uniref:GYD domain-containing protein n=1 Tax=Pseudarthrobacter chlorophenolicus TaxID=85085 RepID=UPI000A689E9B|nr:GYD domain-containing protein [Pseudarthrobacter chlorophenolicus]